MNIDPSIFTVAQLREQVAALDPNRPTSKLRKAELITLLGELAQEELGAQDRIFFNPEDEQAQGPAWEIGTALHAATEAYDAQEDEAQDVAAVDAVIAQEFGDVALSLRDLAEVARKLTDPFGTAMRESAKQIGELAYNHLAATVRSMGRKVTGRVVDTVLRTPDTAGHGRVLVVVEHPNAAPGRKATRTLHSLADVAFAPLAS